METSERAIVDELLDAYAYAYGAVRAFRDEMGAEPDKVLQIRAIEFHDRLVDAEKR